MAAMPLEVSRGLDSTFSAVKMPAIGMDASAESAAREPAGNKATRIVNSVMVAPCEVCQQLACHDTPGNVLRQGNLFASLVAIPFHLPRQMSEPSSILW